MALMLNAIMTFLSIVGMLAIAYGYRGALRERYTATWFFVLSNILLAASVTLRLLYWDIVWVIMKNEWPESAMAWRSIMGRAEMNVVFNAIFLIGVYLGLKSRQLLIPDEERADWPWYVSWLHPTRMRIWPW